MKLVIWGCGTRGKNLYDILNGEDVAAFIDSNAALQGMNYNGTPIISFDEYMQKYKELPVLISPIFKNASISDTLLKNDIIHFSCDILPPEIIELPKPEIMNVIRRKLAENDGDVFLYGLNAYSFLIKLRLGDSFPIKIIPLPDDNNNASAYMEKIYPCCICSCEDACGTAVFATTKKSVIHNNGLTLKCLYDFTYDLPYYRNPELEKLRDIHKNKRCFIVGTGPSLRISDLDKLKKNNELCISVNGIFKAYSETEWRPDYYLIEDKAGFDEWRSEILKADGVKYCLVADSCIDETNDHERFTHFHISKLNVNPANPPEFSRDFAAGAYWSCTITYCALQFAVYLGCTEIYLLGVDFNYSSQYNHFTTDYHSVEDSCDNDQTDQVRKMALGYMVAAETAKNSDFKVYNATRGGMLEAFQRVDFDKLF